MSSNRDVDASESLCIPLDRGYRALLIGWFSTFGDLEVLRWLRRHLEVRSIPYDVCAYSNFVSRSLDSCVDIKSVEPDLYSHLFVVCGPFSRALLERKGVDLNRFSRCCRIGVNLSMLDDEGEFDLLIGRDSSRFSVPDISFACSVGRVPVAGLCCVHAQKEYGQRQRHDVANRLLARCATVRNMATVTLDTKWPAERNSVGLRSPEEFESVVARVDVILTTRLHGMVLALKHGVPALVVDPIAGGGKVVAQARAIGWPEVHRVDSVTMTDLDSSLGRCLDPAARQRAQACARAASEVVERLDNELGRIWT